MPAYAAAKAGIVGVTNALARAFGSDNICVKAIEPGAVNSKGAGLEAFVAIATELGASVLEIYDPWLSCAPASLADRGPRVADEGQVLAIENHQDFGSDELAETRVVDPKKMDSSIRSLIRYGEPDEIADAVALLAGPRTRYMSGQVLRVDGGETLFPG